MKIELFWENTSPFMTDDDIAKKIREAVGLPALSIQVEGERRSISFSGEGLNDVPCGPGQITLCGIVLEQTEDLLRGLGLNPVIEVDGHSLMLYAMHQEAAADARKKIITEVIELHKKVAKWLKHPELAAIRRKLENNQGGA